jgi:integral membrane sensor domain MASE1
VVSFGARLQGSLRKTQELLLLLFCALLFGLELSLLDGHGASCRAPQRG